MLSEEKNALLSAWYEADKTMRAAVDAERELRLQIIETFSTETREDASGVETVSLGRDKWVLKIQHGLNYNLDKDADKVRSSLDVIAKSMEGGKIIADRLVKWKPEISVTEYKKLDREQREEINKVLTIKPKTKSIEIVEEKR